MKSKPNTFCLSVSMILLLAGIMTAPPVLAASAQATVSVKVVRHVSIANKSNMSFGYLSAGAAAGSVVLQQDGSRNPTGGVILESGGSSTPASFTAEGEPNASFAISLPAAITMADSAGNVMTVDDFTSSSGNNATFDDNGRHQLSVGARLHVNPNQTLGDYTGSMQISVNYN